MRRPQVCKQRALISIMQLACFAGFSTGLALFADRNERRHPHHDHLRF
jgi:hypothetical protein